MTLTNSIYCRKRGGMTFWRIGPVGGSFYRATLSNNERAARNERRRSDRRALNAAFRHLRSAMAATAR